jgi:Aldehyde ferredoxin oxidoreductase, N-terminal domain/MoeA C-terminal region (domain IV)
VFSPLVGTPLTTSAKFAVVAKSPLTGMLTDALASSQFAIAGKLTGRDPIVIRGRAEKPAALLIDGDGARLIGAAHLSGLTAAEADAKLRAKLGRNWRVAAIGPAGERGVRYATISHDGRHAGRGGLGAVMGAKNLKAGAVHAAAKVATADPRSVLAAARDLRERSFGPATAKYRELGARQPARVQRHRGAAHPQLPGRELRGRGQPRGTAGRIRSGRHAEGRPQQLRVLHDRLRAHLPGGPGEEGPRRVRERVRARPDVRGQRPRRGARRERPLRRPGHRHDLGGRHDRVGDGVRAARPHRRPVAAVRRLRRPLARPRRDRCWHQAARVPAWRRFKTSIQTLLSVLTAADGYIVIPDEATGLDAGSVVDVTLYA